MRPTTLGFLVALAGAAAASGQSLLCPPAVTTTGACETFHYHVSMFRPDTRQFAEVYGANQFASQTACEHARDAAMKRNGAIVDYFHRVKNDDRFQADVFGTCHCDMTVERSSPNYLNEAQRAAQVRLAEEIRQRVRERLIDSGLTTDNELVRFADFTPPAPAVLGGPKLVPLPAAEPTIATVGIASDLKMTRVEPAAPTAANLDLPLVEIPIPGVAAGTPAGTVVDATAPTAAPPITPPTQVASQPVAAPPVTPTPSPAPPPAPAPIATVAPQAVVPAAKPAPDLPTQIVTADPPPPEPDAADVFISVETQRIQNVLAASNAITDESVKSKVLEACMQRVQLLSNLRSLIEGSGAKSRFAGAARSAHEEQARLALVAKLFGSDIPPHWAPKDATDVVVDLPSDAAMAEKTLSDASAAAEEKRHALYVLLAHTQPTEEQQLWLTSVIDSLLQ